MTDLPHALSSNGFPCPPTPAALLCRLTIVACGLLASGCSLMSAKSTATSESARLTQTGGGSIKLAYESDSGRLNLLTASQTPLNRLVSYQQSRSHQVPQSSIPPFSKCRLSLVSPHPQGKVGYALGVLAVLPESAADGDSALAALWSQLTGDDAPHLSALDSALEIWATDVPQWQVEQLVTRLKNDGFFRRQRVFNADAKLTTEINGVRFGKPTVALAELDALILRVRHEGRLLRRSTVHPQPGGSQPLPELVRLPPVGY